MFSASASIDSTVVCHGRSLSVTRGRLGKMIAAGVAFLLSVSGLPWAGAVVVTDDFSDGNDTANPTWHHLDGAVGSPGQSWTVTNGQYRLVDPVTTTFG